MNVVLDAISEEAGEATRIEFLPQNPSPTSEDDPRFGNF